MINELAHKPYPSGRLTHGLVHAIRELKTKYKIDKDDISSIDCLVPPGVFKLVSRPIIDDLTTNYAKLHNQLINELVATRQCDNQ